jgi:protease-4
MIPRETQVLRQAQRDRMVTFTDIPSIQSRNQISLSLNPITLSLSKGRKFQFLPPHLLLVFLVVSVFLSGCVSVSLFPPRLPLKEKTVEGTGGNKILIVNVSGLIADSKDSGPFDRSDNLLVRIKEELTLAADDEQVKAVIVRINSPGGTVTASDVIYHELARFKEKRKVPIVAVIMDVGASGGYYIAASADQIIAHPTSITGSVGVIMLRVCAEGLLQKIGVDASAIKSGAKKDIGSPFRPMTEEERTILQSMINGFFSRFLEVVSKGRSLSPERVKVIADGRVVTGPQALELGLVDKVGYLEDGIAVAKNLAGLKDARVIMYARPEAEKNNIYALSEGVAGLASLARFDVLSALRGGTPQFMYLWLP